MVSILSLLTWVSSFGKEFNILTHLFLVVAIRNEMPSRLWSWGLSLISFINNLLDSSSFIMRVASCLFLMLRIDRLPLDNIKGVHAIFLQLFPCCFMTFCLQICSL
ncbi:unnamed protein product [Moneuplotes crassus]|uniref:Uncharacterized protein n=1 Tax=Euplotes crassus TaxID=5936 RepID=A0AAD1UER0_EUPCR|nr:unnamed protein product [Moneuplotes crassus]